ncbi:MAG TPA: hypothetical protein PLZ15_11765 [Melioribacteraceae bacterium]|nr:hypothetical protein [Melioribacteraceae bacterium]
MKSKTLILFLLFAFYQTGFGQFEASKSYAGPSLGLSFLGSTFQLGLNYEYGMPLSAIGMSGPGKIGVGGLFRYWSYSEGFGTGEWSYTNILVGAQGNYHFALDNRMWDPYLGLVLAYNIASVKWEGVKGFGWADRSAGGFWLGLHGGVRYFFTPKTALNLRFGFGTLDYGALEIGVDFQL